MSPLNNDFERFKARVQASLPRPSAEEREKNITRAMADFDRHQQSLAQETPQAEPTILQSGLRRFWRGITLRVQSLAQPAPRRRLALAAASIVVLVAMGPFLHDLWNTGNGKDSTLAVAFAREIEDLKEKTENPEVRRILMDVLAALAARDDNSPGSVLASLDPDDESLLALADQIHDASKEPGAMADLRYAVSALTKFLAVAGIWDSLALEARIDELTFADVDWADDPQAAAIFMVVLRNTLEDSTDDLNRDDSTMSLPFTTQRV